MGSLHHCYGNEHHVAQPDVVTAGSGKPICEEEEIASVDPTQLEELGGQTDVSSTFVSTSCVVFKTVYLTSLSLRLILCDAKIWLLTLQSHYGGKQSIYIKCLPCSGSSRNLGIIPQGLSSTESQQ